MCDHSWHLWPKSDQICFSNKTTRNAQKQTRSQVRNRDILWPSQLSQMVTRWIWLEQTLFLFLFGSLIHTLSLVFFISLSHTHIRMWMCVRVTIGHVVWFCGSDSELQCVAVGHFHPKTLIEMWITCLDPVSANSEKGRGSEWAVRVGQRLPSRFGQSGAARELNLVQIVVEAPSIRGGLPST